VGRVFVSTENKNIPVKNVVGRVFVSTENINIPVKNVVGRVFVSTENINNTVKNVVDLNYAKHPSVKPQVTKNTMAIVFVAAFIYAPTLL
jgi:hypothetical protein